MKNSPYGLELWSIYSSILDQVDAFRSVKESLSQSERQVKKRTNLELLQEGKVQPFLNPIEPYLVFISSKLPIWEDCCEIGHLLLTVSSSINLSYPLVESVPYGMRKSEYVCIELVLWYHDIYGYLWSYIMCCLDFFLAIQISISFPVLLRDTFTRT